MKLCSRGCPAPHFTDFLGRPVIWFFCEVGLGFFAGAAATMVAMARGMRILDMYISALEKRGSGVRFGKERGLDENKGWTGKDECAADLSWRSG